MKQILYLQYSILGLLFDLQVAKIFVAMLNLTDLCLQNFVKLKLPFRDISFACTISYGKYLPKILCFLDEPFAIGILELYVGLRWKFCYGHVGLLINMAHLCLITNK
ncbi:hypothetical protein O9G_002724 [Rozella allomycis CSF55]|uniref:Uncharacterized protein n=1 Tax=Rozella allomycis (strain CSF55) TaxID=988480 RepID=A0A075AQY7_ROZAC|nr:hypothetical protein O9G_002724 [Rozella allomycis CSF55]|eukprot:EPZ32638.1 hypothetical protein O9G_002724 [Rozella allomycis CSF55]